MVVLHSEGNISLKKLRVGPSFDSNLLGGLLDMMWNCIGLSCS